MAATASIQIVVDAKGAVESISGLDATAKRIEPSFKKIGDRGNAVMDDLGKRTERARDAVQLLSNVTGVQMPRSLEKVIAKAPGVGSALSAAFGTAALVAFGAQIVRLLSDLDSFRVGAVKAVDTFHIAIDQVKELFGGDTSPELALQRYQKQLVITAPLLQMLTSLQREADTAALEGLDAIEQKRIQDRQDIEKTYHAAIDAARQQYTESAGLVTALNNLKSAKRQAELAADEAAAAKRAALEKQQFLQSVQILAATKEAEQEMGQIVANIALAPLLNKAAQGAIDAAAGIQAMNIQLSQTADRQQELAQRSIEAAQEIKQAQEDAAIALLPPWERSNAQLVEDFNVRAREIAANFKGIDKDGSLTASALSAYWTQTWAHMRDDLADKLEGLFDDITSGNIGRRFLSNFKKLVFEMVASWLLGMRRMQAASTFSFGGVLGALLGIGGLGGGGGGAQAIGSGGTAPGGGSSGGGLLGELFGGLGRLFGGSSSGTAGGLGSLPTELSSSQLGNLGLTALPLSAGGGVGAGGALPAGASAAAGGKLSALAGGLAGLAISGGLGLIGLAGKAGPFGGAALGALGGLVTTGGLIAAFPAILGVLGAATLGIGALIGGIVGLFAGLFGGGKRQRAVEQLGQQVKDQIQKIEDAYNTHQTDASGAISQLEQLRTTAHQQMHKLGGDTRTRVEQPVDAAEKYINDMEAERTRRLAVAFGPAQFRHGGFVESHLARGFPEFFAAGAPRYATGGEVPAILHAGEYVIRPEAVQRIGARNLDVLNNGGGSFGGVHLHGPLIQAQRVDEAWLRNGGATEIWKALQRASREGHI